MSSSGGEPPRRRVLVLSPYSVFPPRYGGALRTYHLCRQLSAHYDVRQFAQQVQRRHLAPTLSPRVEELAPHYVQYGSRNPVSVGLFVLTTVAWASPPVWQSRVLSAFAPPWLRQEVERADIVQVEQPWQFEWAHTHVAGRKPLVLNTQNVEADLYPAEALRAPRRISQRLARSVSEQEASAVRRATLVLTATTEDLASLSSRYGLSAARAALVPNGVDCAAFARPDPQARQEAKRALGLPPLRIVLFMGAVHRPNVIAAQVIADWAASWGGDPVCFVIAGSVGNRVTARAHPGLRVTGPLDDIRPFLQAADVAINPVITGSGSNLKMLEYMAAALPIVTTPVGARGTSVVDGVHALVSDLAEFPQRLRWILGHEEGQAHLGAAARRLAEEQFDWPVIGRRVRALYDALLRGSE